MRRRPVALTLACLATIAAPPLAAQGMVQTIFGHEIYVSSSPGEGGKLMIDGQAALEANEVHLVEIGLLGGAPFVRGLAGQGGTMCGTSPFMISFETERPAVDVFPEECMGPPAEVEDDAVRFEIPGNEVHPARAWLWRPATGFEEIAVEAADTGSGWDAFRTRAIQEPSDLLSYADLAEILRARAGEDFDRVPIAMSGPGTGSYEGSTFVASGCQAHNCGFGGSLVAVDLQAREIYLAWQVGDGGALGVSPAAEDWPEPFQDDLQEWLAQW